MIERDRPPDPMLHVAIAGLCALILIAAFVLQVEADVAVRLPLIGILPDSCWFRRLSSLPCPGCGLTRSFISLAKGELLRAWRFNPVGPILFVLVAAQIPYRVWQHWRIRRGLQEFRWRTWEWFPWIVVLVLLLTQWVVRLSPAADWVGLHAGP